MCLASLDRFACFEVIKVKTSPNNMHLALGRDWSARPILSLFITEDFLPPKSGKLKFCRILQAKRLLQNTLDVLFRNILVRCKCIMRTTKKAGYI